MQNDSGILKMSAVKHSSLGLWATLHVYQRLYQVSYEVTFSTSDAVFCPDLTSQKHIT